MSDITMISVASETYNFVGRGIQYIAAPVYNHLFSAYCSRYRYSFAEIIRFGLVLPYQRLFFYVDIAYEIVL